MTKKRKKERKELFLRDQKKALQTDECTKNVSMEHRGMKLVLPVCLNLNDFYFPEDS
jgi:hypothetical protein